MRGVSAPPGARLEGEGTAAAVAVFVKWLSLAATPAFASMALLTGLDTGPTNSLPSRSHGAPEWNGRHVSADERVPLAALAEAIRAAKWFRPILTRR